MDPAGLPAVPRLRLVSTRAPLDPRLAQFDPDLVRRIYPTLARVVDHYYRGEVEGLEHMQTGPCVVASTHNGSLFTPDLYTLMVGVWRHFGLETRAYGLMHKAVFRAPIVGRLASRLGALHATRSNARLVLRSGFPLLVCPGGDVDALKPFRRRHEVDFGPRRGFIRLALQERVPIIPVVSVGAHEVVFVLNDGRKMARRLGLTRWLRIKSAPLTLGFPLGLSIAGLGCIPLPSKVRVRVLPPIHLNAPPAAADDPELVERIYQRVRGEMQAALQQMAARRRLLLG